MKGRPTSGVGLTLNPQAQGATFGTKFLNRPDAARNPARMAFEHRHINRACWARGLGALVIASIIAASAGCRATPTDVDPIPERTDLAEVCRVDGKWLSPIGSGNHALVGEW